MSESAKSAHQNIASDHRITPAPGEDPGPSDEHMGPDSPDVRLESEVEDPTSATKEEVVAEGLSETPKVIGEVRAPRGEQEPTKRHRQHHEPRETRSSRPVSAPLMQIAQHEESADRDHQDDHERHRALLQEGEPGPPYVLLWATV